MIQIVTIKNPFEPQKRDVSESCYTGKDIGSYVNPEEKDVFLNGRAVENIETIPQDGDQLIIMPHIGGKALKGVLGLVAMVALSVYAGGIANGTMKLFGHLYKAYSVSAMLASGAVMFLGGKIINTIFPQQNPSLSFNEQETSQSYGWDLPTPTQVAGNVIGETYGECIPAAQLLEQHVETVDDKQYLDLLYCGGYGPVDSIDDIRIDYTSISNFSGVQIETRLGTNDQKPISFFKNTPLDQSVGVEMPDNSPVVRTSDSAKASSLEVTLEWAGGLFRVNDKGNYVNATVKFKLEYRLKGGTAWHNFNKTDNNYVYSVTAATNSAIRRTFLIDGLDPGQYEVRVTTVDRPRTSRYQTLYQWTILTSYINGVYSRPGKVLVALRIMATNQLSGGVPSLNWRQTRKYVWVYDPSLKQYVQKAADNPIWAAYDILHGCKQLKNINTGNMEFVVHGVPKESLNAYYDQWQEAADYADEEIKNQDGDMEPRFRFDAFFDSPQKRMTAAQKAANIGHAVIIPHGRNYGVVADKPGSITQIFGEGRTTVSSVKGSFTSKEERARAIEVTYNDSQNDFKNTVLTVRSPNYNTDGGTDNTANLTLFGVKRRSQAYREAITALATNERQLQFIELSTDIDGIVSEYGDIVGYNHAVSRIGIASGRIVSATTTTITLDKEVTLEKSKSYDLYIQRSDDTLQKLTVSASDYAGNVLTLASPIDAENLPQKFDNYAFGEVGKAVKPFRIVNASRNGDLLVSLKLAEYDEAMYATELDYSKYPVIDYVSSPTLDTIKSVTATEQTVSQEYSGISNILVNWEMNGMGTAPESFRIYLTSRNSDYSDIKNVRGLSCMFSNVPPGETYDITVSGVFDAVLYGSKSISIYIHGAAVETRASGFHAVPVAGGIQLVWNTARNSDIASYAVYVGDTLIGMTGGNQIFWACRKSGKYTFSLYQLDKDGNQKYTVLTTEATINLPSAVTDLKAEYLYRHYENGQTGYDVLVTYTVPDDAVTADVWYKTSSTDMSEAGVIPEGTLGTEIGYTVEWKHAGRSVDRVVIPAAKVGDSYKVKVVSVDLYGMETDKPQEITVHIEPKTEVPHTPDNFMADFSTALSFKWDAVTNTDIDFYELRFNQNPGSAVGLIGKTASDSFIYVPDAAMPRSAKVYLYAHNTTGKYGYPAELQYTYRQLDAPTVTFSEIPAGCKITLSALPERANGAKIKIEDKIIKVEATAYTYQGKAGIFDVSACYTDIFGEGYWSTTYLMTVKPTIDPSFFANESITLDMVDKTLKEAVADAQEAIPRLDGIDATLDGIDTTITGLKQTDTELSNTIVENKKTQDGQNSTFASQIKQNANNVTSIVENLNNEDPSSSAYKSIAKLQQTADSISSTVQKNKSDTDTAISKVDQKADSISSTVQDYKTSNDKTVSGLSSKVTQNANSITSIVTNLGKTPAESGYSAITQLQNAVNARVTKNDVINQINISTEGILIDGKKVHITGDTKFDNNVIVNGMLDSKSVSADKIQAGAVGTDQLAAKAVTANKMSVDSLDAITATIGTLRTKTSGARVEIKDNLIQVYDENNVLRVRLGVW